MSDSSDAFDMDDTDQPLPVESPSGSRGFLLLLVATAILSFVLAIAFGTRTAVPPAARLVATVQPAPPVPNQIDQQAAERELADHDRSKGDALMRDGHFEAALHFYRSLGNGNSLRMPSELVIRIAVCQEALGLWDDSLAGFRSIVGRANPAVSSAAHLGQARVWLRLNDFEKAEPLLRYLLIHTNDLELMPAKFIAQVAALFSLTLAEISMPPEFSESQGMRLALSELIELSFEQSLELADFKVPQGSEISNVGVAQQIDTTIPAPAAHPENPTDLPEEHASSQADDADVTTIDITTMDVAPIDDKRVRRWESDRAGPVMGLRRRFPAMTLDDTSFGRLVEYIAHKCEMKLQWKVTNRPRADRHLNLKTTDLPATLLLTLACREMDMVWTTENSGRTIVIADNPPDSPQLELLRLEADATLYAVVAATRDPQMTSPLKFASAQIAEIQDRSADAVRIYSSLVGKSTSQIAICAAYHAALGYYQLRDLPNACQMLEVIVHGAPGYEFHTDALILLGRLLIDQGEFHEAAFQLKRAAESRNSPEEQARAALFCAMAMLLEGRPNDAGQMLFLHRFQFQDQQLRSAAALLTALARFRTISDPEARDREGQFLYRSIAAVEPDSSWLGPSGQLLLGQAMSEAGLTDEMAELYMQWLNRGVPKRVADEMNLELAEYRYEHQHFVEAKSLWTKLYGTEGPCRIKAGLRLAEFALQEKDSINCLKICHDLKDERTIRRRDLLSLAARAYELAGNQALAAHCYAGNWPLP